MGTQSDAADLIGDIAGDNDAAPAGSTPPASASPTSQANPGSMTVTDEGGDVIQLNESGGTNSVTKEQ